MTQPSPVQQTITNLLKAFQTHRKLWIIPTVTIALAALVFAIFKPTTWQASQALVVRDEAGGTMSRPGRFDNMDAMKAMQETITEVARSPVVVGAALKQLGRPPKLAATKPFPTERDIQALQKYIAISAPKGAELGSTEVIYLSVIGSTPHDAIARTNAVCDQLQKYLGDLRSVRADSVTHELEETLNLALTELDSATQRLAAMEREVGSDLGELRVLNQSGAGDGNLRTALNQVKSELRQRRGESEAQRQLQELLLRGQQNPDELLAMPGTMLTSQPALRRLKDGLVDAQLQTSTLLGRMSAGHPVVQAAIRSEEEVRQNLRSELDSALRGLAADLHVTERQIRALEQQHDDLQGRLDRLAGLRATYAVLVDDVQQRTAIVQKAKQDLSDARASLSASQAASLITRFQQPQVGDSPVGPGRLLIVATGLVGGFMTGAGLVFLLAPLGPEGRFGRRLSDYLGFGRRASDRSQISSDMSRVGRRAEDRAVLDSVTQAAGHRNRRSDDRSDKSSQDPTLNLPS